MKKCTTFEDFNAELMAEMILMQAAETESMFSTLDTEIDLQFLDEVAQVDEYESILTDEDKAAIQKFNLLGQESGLEVFTNAAAALNMAGYAEHVSNDTHLRAAEMVSMMDSQDYESESIADCGEWLQRYRRSIRCQAKSKLRYMQGTGYDLDDLIQEASLAIFTGWDDYDEFLGISRENFCWHLIDCRMRELYRSAHAQKRDCSLASDSMDAAVLAHSGLENVHLAGNVTWTSSVRSGESDFEETIAANDVFKSAMEIIPEEENRNILTMLAEGCTQTEIAAAIGKSQSTVSGRISCSRKILKAAIG